MNLTTQIIGDLAGLSLALCGLPQAVQSWRDGHSAGIAWPFLNMWFFGEIGMIIYTLAEIGWDRALLINYSCNVLCLLVILWYKICPRR